jgi:NAD(P)H-dependent FMN reductase
MRLLSIIATERKGNSILASKYIAKQLGASLEILNLSKLEIKPCKACYKCLYGEDCMLEDDVESIFAAIDRAEVVLISSPVYWLDATGKLKAFLDRCFMALRHYERFRGRKALILTYHGFGDLAGWASATHLVLARILGLDVLANVELRAALPAEIFTDKETFEKLDLAVRILKTGEKKIFPGQCEVCMSVVFRVENGKLICPLCGSTFDSKLNLLERGKRFSDEWILVHFSDELIGLKEKYKEIRDELKEASKLALG